MNDHEAQAHAKTAKEALEAGMFKEGAFLRGWPCTVYKTVWLSKEEIQRNDVEQLAEVIKARGRVV